MVRAICRFLLPALLFASALAAAPTIIAHRGNSSEAPENSCAAFISAAEAGADFIECDIHLTKDNIPVILHDPTLERTTDLFCNLHISEILFEELKLLDIGGWFHSAFEGERVPSLEELLLLDLGKTGLMLEIKEESADPERLARRVGEILLSSARSEEAPPVYFASKNLEILRYLRRLLPAYPIIAVVEEEEEIEGACLLRPARVALKERLADPERIAYLKRQGAEVWLWTVDDPARAAVLMEMGADGIITNRPRQLKPLIAPLAVD